MNPGASVGPYDTAIQEIEGQISDLQRTLETLLQLRARHEGAAGVSGAPSRSTGTGEIAHDTFFGMTIGEAAQKYLGMTKVTKSTADIAAALEQGGLKHSSKDFPANVRSIIGQKEEFVRVPNGDWGLADWYPGLGRGKKPSKAEKPAKPKTGAIKSSATKATPKRPPNRSGTDGPTRKERIIVTLKGDPGAAWTAGEVADATNDERRLIQATMSVMASDGELSKDPQGGYRLPKPGTATSGA